MSHREHAVAALGWMGVDLFFVLSGFLITGILLESRKATNYYKAFLMRRLLRIAPVYYLAVIFIFCIAPYVRALWLPGFVGMHSSFRQQIPYWLNLSNLRSAFFPAEVPLASVFWSLAIEEQFYGFWPTVVRRISPRLLESLCLVGVFLSLILRCLPIIQSTNAIYNNFIYRLTPFRLDGLLLGAWLATYLHLGRDPVRLRKASYLCLITSSGILLKFVDVTEPLSPSTERIGFTLIAMLFTSLLALLVTPASSATAWLARTLSLRALRRVGRYSYAMYVFHIPIILYSNPILKQWTRMAMDQNLAIYLSSVIQLGLTYGLAALSWRSGKSYTDAEA